METEVLKAKAGLVASSSFPAFVLVYAALFSAFGLESPFLPAFFAERGLSPGGIGAVLAMGTVVRLAVGPMFGHLADAYNATKLILVVTAVCAGVFGLGYFLGFGFWPILVVATVHAIALAPLNPLADALSLTASAREKVFSYGWVRGVGSAAFIVGTIVSGELVLSYGLPSIILSSSPLFVLLAVAVTSLPRPDPVEKVEQRTTGFRAVFAVPVFRRLLLVAGLIMGSHAMSDTFAVIHWRSAGIDPRAIGFLWSDAVVAEVIMFFFLGPWLLKSAGAARCLALAACAGILRWGLFATTSSLAVLAAAQLLHGFTFALLHLACMRLIVDAIPARLLATAQSVYGTISLGLVSAGLTFVSGNLYAAFDARAFWVMALLCLFALPLALTMQKPAAREALAG